LIGIGFTRRVSVQHRLTANSGHSDEKCYFRDQEINNKADKNASLFHATCVKQDRCATFLNKIVNEKNNYFTISNIIFKYK